ncbi:pentapeptide repeat-containing protein [Oscillochloris sp. ZM17-4]|uniref:pentapeptide repeat-containing protein n=1 Tax=Oscillochloris sp. ZM17-4 TaxID=2866714 RepID=UPI001C72B47D|nr:pentapeptide repeat-containing protein [Oscillochloris sp. ZM17-4]MBX0326629.1 pentapeptide repeat-containing protein [Oscillochloris sp. ZM17-4]
MAGRLDDVLVQRGNAEALRCWGATLRSVRFERCALRGASFAGSNLSGVIFRDCDLTGADFRETTLRGADLRGSTLAGLQVGLREIQGAIVSPSQAAELAAILGLAVTPEEPGA